MSIAEQIHRLARNVQTVLRSETVTLVAADISTEISDVVVSLAPPAASRDGGPVQREGALRLPAAHHAAFKAAHKVTVRGHVWDILTVDDATYAGRFRVEISRIDQDHSNHFDLSQEQGRW
jgi:hypothetical protein